MTVSARTRRARAAAFAAAALMAALAPAAAVADDNAAYQVLLDQAKYWRERNRPDLAAQALDRLLASAPEHPEALFQLAVFEAQNGRTAAAQRYRDKLRALNPGDPRIAVVDQAIRTGQVDGPALEEARRLSRDGDYRKALEIYRGIFQGSEPYPNLAVEYYETLAGTEEGWSDAKRRLERLATGPGADARARLAYARMLTYRDESRRDGIALLQPLAGDANVGSRATEAWRQALLWLGDTPETRPFLSAYLASHPDEAAIKEKLEQIDRPSPAKEAEAAARRRTEGFGALQKGQLGDAAKKFEQVIGDKADDAEAVGGLGLVKLRLGDFAAAQDLLAKAVALAPARRAQWEPALKSAQFWDGMARAKAARDADPQAAERILRQITAIDQPDRIYGELMLAELLERRGNLAAAEGEYRRLRAAHPENADIAMALFGVLVRSDKAKEALAFADALGPGLRARLKGYDTLKAELLRGAAEDADRTGDAGRAAQTYEQALAMDPQNPWVRLDYARHLLRTGRKEAASSLIDALIKPSTASPDALHAGAIFYGELAQWQEAFALIERIPPAKRTAEIAAFRDRLVAGKQIEAATAAAAGGDVRAARAQLERLAAEQSGKPEQAAQIAIALAETGDAAQALKLMREAYARQADPPPGLTLQYIALLVRTGQTAEASAQVRKLERATSLTAKERQDLAHLRAAMVSRQSDDLRGRGDFAAAYDVLAPQLAGDAVEPPVMLALANIYLSAKRPIEALQIYNAVLNRDPGNADALNGAIGAAIDAKDLDTARFLVGRALQRDPNSARFVYLAGQLARMSGDNRTALRYLEAARSLHRGEIERQPQGAPERPANPFRDPAASSAPGLAPADMAVRPAPGRQYAAITTGPVASSPELPRIVGALSPTPAVDPLGRDIETSLRDIRTEVAPAVEGVVGYRSRSGESGLSHLSTMDAAATASFSPGYYGRLSATLNPVHLDAGPVDTDPGVQRRFGSGPFQPITTANQKANGVGVGVAYALRDFGADVGLTPLGFPTTARPVGSVSYAPRLFGSQATLKGQLMRRPVTETLLSYSGTKDPGTGQIFGAVLKTGGRLDVEHDDGFFGAYANGSYFTYEGQHVASNTSYEGGVGAFVRPYKTEDQTLKAGVNVTFLSFEKNLGKFTLGHGGYFSPQDYVALSFPVEFTGTADRFKYTLGGALGLQSYNEKSAPYFPVDAAKQASLVALAASDPTIQAVYPSRSQTGVGVNFSGDVQYRLTDTLTLGGRVSYDNFGNYSEQSARLYLKRSFPGTN